MRPLSAAGRWQRCWPFASAVLLCLVVAWLSPTVRPGALVAAVAQALLLAAAIVWVPWHRLPADAEALPALAFIGVFAVLRLGGGIGFSPMLFLSLLWLALYHSRTMLVIGLASSGVAMLSLAGEHGEALPTGEWRRGLLAVVTAVILLATVQRRMARSRRAGDKLTAANRQARRERDFTEAVLDAAGFFVVVLDARGRIILFNRRCEELTGYRAEDVHGREFWDVVLHRDEIASVRDAFDRLTAAAFPNSFENDWLAADGTRRRIAWSNTALTDDTGGVDHVIGTGLDVTEQRRTERLFADVLAAATEQAIIGTDGAGTVTVFNAGAERLLGYPAAEVVGAVTIERFHLAEELADGRGLFAPARAARTDEREWTYVRRDGTRFSVAVTVSAMRDESGEIVGYLSVARDVSQERRTAEAMRQAYERERAAAVQLRELDRVRSDLVAVVSHELRTPLTSILGNVELLVDGDAGPVPASQLRVLTAVDRNARRLLALIEDLLMLSRIEAGAVKINAQPIPVRAVVGGALEALASVRATRDVELAVQLPEEPILVYGDRSQLERVVINLVDNALKFTPPGGRASIRVETVDGQVRLVVTDTGIGIPAEEIDHVFDQFFRSTRSQERASPGSGLGLAITKSIVERHGGHIRAAASVGGGTEVTCLLPAPPAAAHAAPVRVR